MISLSLFLFLFLFLRHSLFYSLLLCHSRRLSRLSPVAWMKDGLRDGWMEGRMDGFVQNATRMCFAPYV